MPDLLGLSLPDAIQAMEEIGITHYTWTEGQAYTVLPGQIYDMTPLPGEHILPNLTVASLRLRPGEQPTIDTNLQHTAILPASWFQSYSGYFYPNLVEQNTRSQECGGFCVGWTTSDLDVYVDLDCELYCLGDTLYQTGTYMLDRSDGSVLYISEGAMPYCAGAHPDTSVASSITVGDRTFSYYSIDVTETRRVDVTNGFWEHHDSTTLYCHTSTGLLLGCTGMSTSSFTGQVGDHHFDQWDSGAGGTWELWMDGTDLDTQFQGTDN